MVLALTALLPVALVSQAGATMVEDASGAYTGVIADSSVGSDILNEGNEFSVLESTSGEDQGLTGTTVSTAETQSSAEDETHEPGQAPSGKDEPTGPEEAVAAVAQDEQTPQAKTRAYTAPSEADAVADESGIGVVLGPATVYESPDQEEPIFLYGGPVTAKRAATVVTTDRSVDPSASPGEEPEDAEWDGSIDPSFNETPTTFTSWRENTSEGIDVDDDVVVDDDITVEEPQSEGSREPAQAVAVASLAQTGANPVLLGLAGLVVALGIAGVATRYYYGKTRED